MTRTVAPHGNVTGVKDPNGNTNAYVFDALNRVSVTVDGGGNRTTKMFDAAGNLTSVKDPDANVTTFLYDAVNRVTQQTSRAASATMRRHGYANGYARALVTGLWPSLDILPAAERSMAGKRLRSRTLALKPKPALQSSGTQPTISA